MGGPLSLSFSDMYMPKMESEIVIPQKPLFCLRYVDDSCNRRKMFKRDELFEKLNNYHPEIKLTIEVSRTNVLNTSLHPNNGIYDFKVYRKTTKQPTHWSSKTPKRYKRNKILGHLHRSNHISSNFSEKIRFISHKYEQVDCRNRFINSVIRQFQDRSNQSNIDNFDDYIIPPNFFDIPKSFILTGLSFCENNEIKIKHFLRKFHRFTKDCFKVAIKWKTGETKTLFLLKDESIHSSFVIYKGTCSCGEIYIGETIRNSSIRWEERNDPTKKSETVKHLKNNFHNVFNRVILWKAPQIKKSDII